MGWSSANSLQARLLGTIINVCNSKTPHQDITNFKADLQTYLDQTKISGEITIKIIRYDDIAKVILKKAQLHDMVILRSVRRRTAGGLTVSDVTTQVISELTCSIVLFGDTV